MSACLDKYQVGDTYNLTIPLTSGAYFLSNIFEAKQLLMAEPSILVNSEATRSKIIGKIRDNLINNPAIKKEDWVIFHFSGHGLIMNGKAGICPYDFHKTSNTFITDEEIISLLSTSPAKYKICFIESCNNGIEDANISTEIIRQIEEHRAMIDDGIIYITSSKPGQKSWGNMHMGGFFTYYLTTGLKGAADLNLDKNITIEELFEFIKLSIKDQETASQVPQLYTGDKNLNEIILQLNKPFNNKFEADARVSLRDASLLFKQKKYDEAFQLYIKYSSSIYFTHHLQHELGLMFANGWGTRIDLKKMVYWYQNAAQTGNSPAQVKLSTIYVQGDILPKDHDKAFKYAKMATNQNDIAGKNALGYLYFHGLGVSPNLIKAFQLFRESAIAGLSDGQFNLANAYHHGIGIKADINQAIYWYTKAAQSGHIDAQLILGLLYLKGPKSIQNHEMAIQFFFEAANKGDSRAQSQLARLYILGEYFNQDFEAAYRLFKLSADQGDIDGLGGLGIMHINGQGSAKKDLLKAEQYLLPGAKAGYPEYQYNLGLIYLEKNKLEEAEMYINKAVDQNFPMAINFMGLLYENNQDLVRAIAYYRKAARLGYKDSQNALIRLGKRW